jgi:hypothetical protein
MTKEWLKEYYGSESNQEQQAKDWMLQYGHSFTTVRQMEEWKIWKHLVEYSPNTHDIVQQCLDKITGMFQFESELQAHRFVNMLRVPLSASYEEALEIVKPRSILELGIGGDSGISTAVFLAYVEKVGGKLFSIDLNPLNMTGKRYEKYQGTLWEFKYDDSVTFLSEKKAKGNRFDMIFIDTSHTYEHTMNELNIASQITDFMLMDDALFTGNATDSIMGGVKKAISDWFDTNQGWKQLEFWGGKYGTYFKRGSKGGNC